MAEPSLAEILRRRPSGVATSTRRSRQAAAFADEVRALNADFADTVERMIDRLRASGAGEEAPKPGEPMPDFMLPDHRGHLVSLSDLIANGPVVIAFHRGHWCPYCRITADALSGIHASVQKLGAELVVITPEIERFNTELRSTAAAQFPCCPTWTTATP